MGTQAAKGTDRLTQPRMVLGKNRLLAVMVSITPLPQDIFNIQQMQAGKGSITSFAHW